MTTPETLRSEEEVSANLRRIAWQNIYRGTSWTASFTVFVDWWRRW